MSIKETTTEQNTEQLDQQQEPQIEYGEADSQDEGEGDSQPSRMESLLDSLTDDGEAGEATDEGQPPQVPATEEQLGAEPKQEHQQTPEQEDAALLDEAGVKERGRQRLQEKLAHGREVEAQLTQANQQLEQFRTVVQDSGMSGEDFARVLQYSKLVASGDANNLRVAMAYLDEQRTLLAQQLGEEVPGVNPLQQHPDLQQKVDSYEITREHALELAKYRHAESQRQQQLQVQQQSVQEHQQFQATVQQASAQVEAYLQTRANELDHKPRMAAIQAYFANPENLQRFVATHAPEQWAQAVQWMYDSVQPARQAAPAQQPIRSRPSLLGAPSASAMAPEDRIAQHMQRMGL